MAEKYYDHADHHLVEAHAHEDLAAGIQNHVPRIKSGDFPHVKRLDDGTWVACEESESDGKIVGEIGVMPPEPSRPGGRNPITMEISPSVPAQPARRHKVVIAIHPHRREAIAAKLGFTPAASTKTE